MKLEELVYKKRLDIAVREPIHVSVDDFKGRILLDVRHYYVDDEGEKPGRRGINVPVKDAVELAKAILEAHNETVGGNLSIVGQTPA